MKIFDCQLFVYIYRTIGDKVKGASFIGLVLIAQNQLAVSFNVENIVHDQYSIWNFIDCNFGDNSGFCINGIIVDISFKSPGSRVVFPNITTQPKGFVFLKVISFPSDPMAIVDADGVSGL